ncbi:hypothetical protein D3C83_122400 [compost metagenome]
MNATSEMQRAISMLDGMAGPPDASTTDSGWSERHQTTDWWMIGMSIAPMMPITAAYREARSSSSTDARSIR